MKRAKTKGIIKKEAPDLISGLPDKILSFILSLVSIDEAVRSSVLSKRWKNLWKQIPRLDFDVNHMIHPLSRLNFNTSPEDHLDLIFNHLDKEKGIYRYSILFFRIMQQHIGHLTSCRFFHFPNNCLRACITLLFDKKELGLKDLTLQCENMGAQLKPNFPIPYYFANTFSSLDSLELIMYRLDSASPFASCKNLRTLKLKDLHVIDEVLDEILTSCQSLENFTLSRSSGFMQIKFEKPSLKFLELNFLWLDEIEIVAVNLEVVVLVSLSCPAKDLVLEAPNLKVFNCFNNYEQLPIQCDALKTHELLEYSSDLLMGSERVKGFKNLSSMSIDLDLNDEKQTFSLSYMLRSCDQLRTLRVVIPANSGRRSRHIGGASMLNPRRSSNFWEGREICNCVRRELRFVYVEGFTGKDLEFKFIEYLIEISARIKKITIICNNIGSMEDARKLCSLKSASKDLTIKLMLAKRG